MKIVIAPEYRYLRQQIENIPNRNYQIFKTFCNRRNTVEGVYFGNQRFVIKKYKRPTLANCLVYTWFRKTKPKRAYEYAQRLLEKGIKTPKPVAYIEIKKHLFFHTGYFISEYLPFPTLKEAYCNTTESRMKEKMEKAFVDFLICLHTDKQIIQTDSVSSNYLVNENNGNHEFILVDVNRIRFGKTPSIRQAMKSFNQLCNDYHELAKVVPHYMEARKADVEKGFSYILLTKYSSRIRSRLKAIIRKIFLNK